MLHREANYLDQFAYEANMQYIKMQTLLFLNQYVQQVLKNMFQSKHSHRSFLSFWLVKINAFIQYTILIPNVSKCQYGSD